MCSPTAGCASAWGAAFPPASSRRFAASEEAACFRYGGMATEDTSASMALFAEKVLPELKSW